MLVTRVNATLRELPAGAKVATSSARRARQLLNVRPDLQVIEIRGNVPTRLGKLASDASLSGLVLAKAGLQRLGFASEPGLVRTAGMTLHAAELREMLPAAGQGIIGLEIKAGNGPARAYLDRVNDSPTWHCALAERNFLRLIDGGCGVPVGLRSWVTGEELHMEAVVFDQGVTPRSGKVVAPVQDHRGAAVALLEKVYEDGR